MPTPTRKHRIQKWMESASKADKQTVQRAMDAGISPSIILVLIQTFLGPLLKQLIDRLIKEKNASPDEDDEDQNDEE